MRDPQNTEKRRRMSNGGRALPVAEKRGGFDQRTIQEIAADVISLVQCASGIMRDLSAQVEFHANRGVKIPAQLLMNCRAVVKVYLPLRERLMAFGAILEAVAVPGHLPADLCFCADPSLPDGLRHEAIDRIVDQNVGEFPRTIGRRLRQDFFRTLMEEAPRLSYQEALRWRLKSCLVEVAPDVMTSNTIGELLAIGQKVLQRHLVRALVEDVLGPWCRSASGSVAELDPDTQDHGPSPETVAELRCLGSVPGLTHAERSILDAAVRIGSASPRDIASTLGRRAGLVRVHLYHARRKIRQEAP